ncbi:DNA repair protein [Enterococcus durans]|uniref:DNA repair protein n=1 Tax=Enterococcus durans TaxID=53345 RepID=A0A5N0YZ27_9ENTE|nr:DNA repair protein [Enterococcus durans]KAA9196309.1 DNA repair protein [Enterococcus durans]KAA9208127.1 DNA repair protein [Enterococcus durans]TKN20837.1 DNA repair protein [Enterococcus sp. VV15]
MGPHSDFYICANLYYPSGNVIPSKQDVQFTRRVQRCGEMMGIDVLDHLIIGQKQYFSLREEGILEE